MSDLSIVAYMRTHKTKFNLADISRRSGLSTSYLKHVVAGRRRFSPEAEKRVREVLESIMVDFPKGI